MPDLKLEIYLMQNTRHKIYFGKLLNVKMLNQSIHVSQYINRIDNVAIYSIFPLVNTGNFVMSIFYNICLL